MRFLNEKAINGGDVSQATVASSPINAQYLVAGSAQCVVSGGLSPVGVLKVQFSNDAPTTASASIHWSDVPSATVAVSADGNFGIGKFDIAYQWIRLLYTKTSGAGSITANINGFGF